MALTPEEVVNKRFQPTKFREGYDQDEVDDFLDEVVNELRRLHAENDDLRERLGACERRVGELTGGTGSEEATAAGATVAEPTPAGATAAAAAEQDARPEAVSEGPAREPAAAAAPAAAAPAPAATAAADGPEAAAGMLLLAQKVHDDYVRSGEEERDRIVTEAQEHASRLVSDAEERQRQTLSELERDRSLLERTIDELRAFERDYRTRLRAYLEDQLRDLDSRGALVPEPGPEGG